MSSLIFWLQVRELRLAVCFNAFRNFIRRLKKRQISVPFTNNYNWMNGREMFRQMSSKQANAQTQARQPNKQMVESAGRFSLPKLKQQRQRTTPKTTSIKNRLNIFKLQILAEEISFTESVCLHCQKYPWNKICKTASKFEREMLKIDVTIV